jgi:hypothetical protein
MFADAVIVLVVVDAATMVTGPAAAGAVYEVVTVLAVCAGVKVPHVAAGVQLQSTPPFAESFVTVAAIVAVAFTAREVGGAVLSEMASAGGGVTLELLPHPTPTSRASKITTANVQLFFMAFSRLSFWRNRSKRCAVSHNRDVTNPPNESTLLDCGATGQLPRAAYIFREYGRPRAR